MFGDQVKHTGSWVNKLIFINIIFYLLQIIFRDYQAMMMYYLGLTPAIIVSKGFVWQIFSYMFLHSTETVFHLFFNMYGLLLFGSPIEQVWGSKRFLKYYLFTGIGAGIVIFIINLFVIGGAAAYIPTIGASGAVFGLLLAFGLLFPEAELLMFFFIPMKAKYLVFLYGFLELYMLFSFGGKGNISHVGHLGGLLFGIIYFLILRKNLIKFKAKELSARAGKESKTRENIVKKNKYEKKERLYNILIEVRENGIDSISDDDYQFVREIDIMIDHEKEKNCPDITIAGDDKSVMDNEFFEICVMNELREHL